MNAEQYFKDHGLSQETITKFDIIWNKEKITIPVKDENGVILFNKYRHLDFDKEKPESKKFSYDSGAHATLFNTEALKDSTYVFLTEGEPDCMRLAQEGIVAVCATSGASTFKEEWLPFLENRKVYICYDTDEAGVEGANKIQELIPTAIRVILPSNYKDICEYFQENTKAQFRAMVEDITKESTITIEEYCQILDKWLLIPDKNVIDIFLGALIAHKFTSDPLWLFFVAPPSGSKTEIIQAAESLPFVHMLSDLTGQTLASGMIAKNDPSLLLKLKDNVLLMKDFTTVLQMRREDRQIILSQFREVYDGHYSKSFGTGKTVDWKGRLTLIAGVTPIIDTYSSLSQIMGERFVMYRVPQPKDTEVAKRAMRNSGFESKMREEIRDGMTKLFAGIVIPHVKEIEVPDEIFDALASLASWVVRGRSGVIRDQFKREVEYIPAIEAPSRLAKQFITHLRGVATARGRKNVMWKDYYLILKEAIDTMPMNRTVHFIANCNQANPLTTTQVAQVTNYSRSGSEMLLEDLTAVELLEVIRTGSGKANEWQISQISREYFNQILPYTTPELDEVFYKGHMYRPIIDEMLKGSTPIKEEEKKWETPTKLF
jgi:5S rRNA maturation endonuclease (ribonuclease M5)